MQGLSFLDITYFNVGLFNHNNLPDFILGKKYNIYIHIYTQVDNQILKQLLLTNSSLMHYSVIQIPVYEEIVNGNSDIMEDEWEEVVTTKKNRSAVTRRADITKYIFFCTNRPCLSKQNFFVSKGTLFVLEKSFLEWQNLTMDNMDQEIYFVQSQELLLCVFNLTAFMCIQFL